MMKLVLLISITMLAFMIGCDVLDDFEDETYEMEPFDEIAATSFRATIDKKFSGKVILNSNPDTLELDSLYKVLILNDNYIFTANELLTRIDTLVVYDTTFVNDTTFTVDSTEVYEEVETYTKQLIGATSPMTYFVLEGVNTGEVVFYFSDYVRTKVYDVDISVSDSLEILDETIPLELSSGIFTISNRIAQPVVKSRYVYELQSGGKYLVGIQKLEQTLGSSFNAVIINK